LSNVVEENEDTPLYLNERPTTDDESELGMTGVDVHYRLPQIGRLLPVFSVGLSILTLIVEAVRLGANTENWRNRERHQLIAPIVAFSSFDILVHLIVILYFVLSRIFHFTIVSTKPLSTHAGASRGRRSKQGHGFRLMITAAYLVETFIIILFVIGLPIDLGTHMPGKVIGQIFGWLTV